ncbi:MAG: hypothetical protein LAN37_02635 [Acidobacteriia bacterium]|nr:hypothetical protein [Terriglobia bacterium]
MLRNLAVVVFVLALVVMPPVQISRSTPPAPLPVPQTVDASQERPGEKRPPTPDEIRLEKTRKKELGKQRYQELRRDSEQLVLLANQLKRYVDTAGENTLSLDVVKKAEEIEKLAKSVKTKMKGD